MTEHDCASCNCCCDCRHLTLLLVQPVGPSCPAPRLEEGPQQGDPLGPLLFCLTVQPLLQSLSSELALGYMDDFTLGGRKSTVADDINIITTVGPSYGLHLNISKCEAISNTGAANHPSLDGFEQKIADSATLLGAALSTGSALTECLTARQSYRET